MPGVVGEGEGRSRPLTASSQLMLHPAMKTKMVEPGLRGQLSRGGMAWDWSRAVDTSRPRLLPLDPVDPHPVVPCRAHVPGGDPRRLVSPRASPCSPENRPTRPRESRCATGATPRLRSAGCVSGSCGRPHTRTACSRAWAGWTGPSGQPGNAPDPSSRRHARGPAECTNLSEGTGPRLSPHTGVEGLRGRALRRQPVPDPSIRRPRRVRRDDGQTPPR